MGTSVVASSVVYLWLKIFVYIGISPTNSAGCKADCALCVSADRLCLQAITGSIFLAVSPFTIRRNFAHHVS